jgi:Uma2 family endonuclease
VTTMAQSQSNLLCFATFEEFLDWERHQETKHELVNGEPVAMAGGNDGHNIIQGNLFAAALAKLR